MFVVVVIGRSFFLDTEVIYFFDLYSIVERFELDIPSGIMIYFYSFSIELLGAR
jgi:hypothetical protein